MLIDARTYAIVHAIVELFTVRDALLVKLLTLYNYVVKYCSFIQKAFTSKPKPGLVPYSYSCLCERGLS